LEISGKTNYEKNNTEKSNEEYGYGVKYFKRKKKYIVVILSHIPNDRPTK
jgi:hypothetical protein